MPCRTVHAVCTLDCPDSCAILVTVDELTGRATKVQGDPSHPVTRGFLCGKVARYLDRVYAPDRLLHPMHRKAGVPKGPLEQGREADAFQRITWDDALCEITSRLRRISAEHGPESILPYSYAGTIGQLGYASMDQRFFHRLGASQLDRTICAAAGAAALNAVYGTRLGTAPQDFAHAGLILAWGANIHGNNIHLWPFIEEARRNGAKLVVIDPYKTRTAALADDWLPIRPGTDVLLALSLMHILFRDGLHDLSYLDACAPDWPALRDHALQPEHSPAAAAEITGIPVATIERLALAYGQAGTDGRAPAVIRLNYGVQRSENGGTAVRAVSMLPLLTGSWQHQGGGLLLSTRGAFPFNQAALQRPDLMLASPLGRPARTINMNQLGQALTEPVGTPVHALFVYNSNPAAVAPDSNAVLAGLRRPDLFTVVHEQFYTDTADYADILLPATTFLEHKELMGAYGHYFAQISDAAIAPLGEARANPLLFAELGRRMGFRDPCFHDTEDDLIAQALTSTHPLASTLTPEALNRDKHVPLSLPRNAAGQTLPFSDATWFQTSTGVANLYPLPTWAAPAESRLNASLALQKQSSRPERSEAEVSAVSCEAEAPYPLEFLPRKADNFMNSTFANLPNHQTMERRTAGILEMHPTDAVPRNIATGDAVLIFNDRGRIELVARVGNSITPGAVAARLDWHKLSADNANVNTLTSQRLSDLGGGATFYSTLVEVARLHPIAAD